MVLCWFSANSNGIMQGVKPIVKHAAGLTMAASLRNRCEETPVQ
jgi:hypothetical protein